MYVFCSSHKLLSVLLDFHSVKISKPLVPSSSQLVFSPESHENDIDNYLQLLYSPDKHIYLKETKLINTFHFWISSNLPVAVQLQKHKRYQKLIISTNNTKTFSIRICSTEESCKILILIYCLHFRTYSLSLMQEIYT